MTYTESDTEKLRQVLKTFSSDNCVLISLRAGILAKDESVKNIKDLMTEFPDTVVLVWSETYDFVNIKNFSSALKVLGKERILLKLPRHLNLQLRSFDATGVVTSVLDSLDADDSAASTNKAVFSTLLPLMTSLVFIHEARKSW